MCRLCFFPTDKGVRSLTIVSAFYSVLLMLIFVLTEPAHGYHNILLVQDIFTRYLYARALTNVSQTTTAFEAILGAKTGTVALLTKFQTN